MNELRLRRLVFGTLILVQVIFGIAFVVAGAAALFR